MDWFAAILGGAIAGPLGVAATLWLSRRTWRSTRRLAARTRGHEHLIKLGQLVGGLAHEIKNPLSTINMNLKLLSEDLARHDDEDHRRLARRLKAVQIEADRVKDILDDFLRFAGKVELSLEPTDLRRVIEELLDFFAPQADAAHVLLRTSLPADEVRCLVDANFIKQALLNLMINAVQAMEGGGELLIRLSSQRRDAIIEVIDTGPGMTGDVLDRIFQAYFSTKKNGTGLGLPTTQRIIREHGGDIHVQSEPGKGTRFVIKLPRQK